MDTAQSGRQSAEPYLIANPAFEAYLDSSSTDPDSRESDACTTPRSAIKSQVCTDPQPSNHAHLRPHSNQHGTIRDDSGLP